VYRSIITGLGAFSFKINASSIEYQVRGLAGGASWAAANRGRHKIASKTYFMVQ
jgi:hypothetical protein